MRGLKKLLDNNPGLYDELRARRKDQTNRARVLLDELKETYDWIFNEDHPLPLSVDVIKDIKERYPEYNQAEIEQCLMIWCRRKIYRQRLIEIDERFDLSAQWVSL